MWLRILRLLPILVLVSLLIPVTLAHAQAGSGMVLISDGTALSDLATITMSDVPAPEAGKVYEGWFVTDDGSRKVSTGILSRDSDGNISHTFFQAEASPARPELPEDVAAARAATAKYRDVQRALDDGYLANDDCVSAPGLGTMGFHYANIPLIVDPALNALTPEVLLYVPSGRGIALAGIEYRFGIGGPDEPIPDSPPPAPSIFGQAFDGPMVGHFPGDGPHYDLHVWVFAENPAGLFAAFNSNPNLTCEPAGTGENLFASTSVPATVSDMNDRFATEKGASGTAKVTAVQQGSFLVDEVVVSGLEADHTYDVMLVVTPEGTGLEGVLDQSNWITAAIVNGTADANGVVIYNNAPIPDLPVGGPYRLDIIVAHDHPDAPLDRDFLAACQPFFNITLRAASDPGFGDFDKFVVTVEPADDPDPAPSGVVAFSHQIPTAGLTHIRHLVFSWRGNPAYTSGAHKGIPKGIAVGLREQTGEAWTHAKLAQTAAAALNLAAAQLHACHVVNILDGYNKTDADAACPGPGDGFGALNYATDAAKHAGFARDAAPNDPTLARFAPAVIASSGEVTDQAGRASIEAKLAMNSDDLLAAALFINNVEKLLQDDMEAHTGALHSARHAYVSSQEMGTYTIASLPSVGEPLIPQLARIVLIGGIALLLAGVVIGVSARLRPSLR